MPKIRVNRNKGYTVMSNHHLKDKSLSLKSKGLLSMMLSLPDEWHYSTKGLAAICKEGVDAVSSAIKELEKAGYIIRNKIRDERGRIAETEYIIYEEPQNEMNSKSEQKEKESLESLKTDEKQEVEEPKYEEPKHEEPKTDFPHMVNSDSENSNAESLSLETPNSEEPAQLSIKELNKKESKTNILNNQSIKSIFKYDKHHFFYLLLILCKSCYY